MVGLKIDNTIDEFYHMMTYIQHSIDKLKKEISTHGFPDETEEINFFRKIKPQILGKLN